MSKAGEGYAGALRCKGPASVCGGGAGWRQRTVLTAEVRRLG